MKRIILSLMMVSAGALSICPAAAQEKKPSVVAALTLSPEEIKVIVGEAEEALKQGPFTIVNKPKLPASNDPHDFFTSAPYWWPNPNTPNGLPYVRKDGEFNKENRYDLDNLGKLIRAVRKLAVAYHFTHDEKYAQHAVMLIRAWFLDEKTKMNPHLRHSQAIPGTNDGRPIGIIDAWEMPYLLDSIYLIQKSQAWTPQIKSGVVAWFSEFLDWFLKSDFGKAEAAEKNNHGTWYLAQISAYALFTNRTEEVKSILEKSVAALLQSQIAEDGSQPLEIARTRSLHYSIFNLIPWLDVYWRCQKMNVSVLRPNSAEVLKIKKAAQYLCDKAGPGKTWPHPEMSKTIPRELSGALVRAGEYFQDANLVSVGESMGQRKDSKSILQILTLLAPQ